jgi:hypothetical protein
MEPPRLHYLHARLFLLPTLAVLLLSQPSSHMRFLMCLFPRSSPFRVSQYMFQLSLFSSISIYMGLDWSCLFVCFSIGSHSTLALEQVVICLVFFCLIHTKSKVITCLSLDKGDKSTLSLLVVATRTCALSRLKAGK